MSDRINDIEDRLARVEQELAALRDDDQRVKILEEQLARVTSEKIALESEIARLKLENKC